MVLMKQHSIHKIRLSRNDRGWQEKCANASTWSKYDKRPDVSQRAWHDAILKGIWYVPHANAYLFAVKQMTKTATTQP
jgi:hypothetical protein